MSSVVFILGAGASKQCGAPLIVDFLDVASHLYRTDASGDKKADFERVFRAIGALQAVHSKAQLELTVSFPTSKSYIGVPAPYKLFTDLLNYLRREAFPTHTVSVITFNTTSLWIWPCSVPRWGRITESRRRFLTIVRCLS